MEAKRKHEAVNKDERSAEYNKLAFALHDSRAGTYRYSKGPCGDLLPRAADAIMKLVPPPEWSEADEAAWEPFLKGKKGHD